MSEASKANALMLEVPFYLAPYCQTPCLMFQPALSSAMPWLALWGLNVGRFALFHVILDVCIVTKEFWRRVLCVQLALHYLTMHGVCKASSLCREWSRASRELSDASAALYGMPCGASGKGLPLTARHLFGSQLTGRLMESMPPSSWVEPGFKTQGPPKSGTPVNEWYGLAPRHGGKGTLGPHDLLP